MRQILAPAIGSSIILAVCAILAWPLLAQDEVLKSGPQPGTVMPGSFPAFNLNGKVGAGRHHCLVCEFNLDPVLLIFTREPQAGKDMVLNNFLQQVDKAVDRHELFFLRSFVVFLSGKARSSVTDPGIDDLEKLVDEATLRRGFVDSLKPRVEMTRNLRYAIFPAEGPKDFHLDPKAEVTVVFFKRHRVLANFAFAADQLTAADADNILRAVDRLISVEPLEK